MKKTLFATVSASVLALSMPVAVIAQEGAVQAEIEAGMAPGQFRQALEVIKTACESGNTLPDGIDCARVDGLLDDNQALQDVLGNPDEMAIFAQSYAAISSEDAVDGAIADLKSELGAAMGVEPNEIQPSAAAGEQADAAQTDASEQALGEAVQDAIDGDQSQQAQAATETPAAEATPEPETTAEAGTEAVDENALAQGEQAEVEPQVEAEGQEQTAEAVAESGSDEQTAQDAPGVEEPETVTSPVEEQATEAPAPQEPPEMDSQAQADAIAQQEQQAPAAAASDPNAQAEVVEETVQENEVRRSSEDFATQVLRQIQNPGDEAAEGDDGNKALDRFRDAALLGLGAVALNELLQQDERVVSNSGDRVVIQGDDGRVRLLRNDDVLLRRPGADVQTYNYQDGSTRMVVTYDDGTVVETVRAADGRVLRRTRTLPDGTDVVLFDDTQTAEEVVINDLPQVEDAPTRIEPVGDEDLAAALARQETVAINRSFSLNQIRNIDRVRAFAPEVSLDTINFQTNSAAIRPDEAEELAAVGRAMREIIDQRPGEVFLIEGHTDAVGNYAYNLALSDRRAESVALALTEYFDVPPENMILQGYGESDLLIETQDDERRNRRAVVRRITPLLTASR